MKTFEKSESIKAGIRKSFQTGNSKLARRKCTAIGIMESSHIRVCRVADNMRNVAVTEGDKVEAQIKFGWEIDAYPVNEIAEYVQDVKKGDIDVLVEEYYNKYEILLEGRDPEEFKRHVEVQAGIEIGFERFLEEKNYQAIVTHFGDLGSLKQLPGLAIQRLMEKGYGFGGEGDWKTAAMVRLMKIMAAGIKDAKGTSFMEDYTYNLVPGKEGILQAHMLEVCPSVSEGKIGIKVCPLSMGDREDPARLVFTSKEGPAIATSLVDLGDRFRLIINDVECKKVEKPMPKLPVGTAFWTPKPDLATGAEAWILAGGAHHTAFSYDLTAEQMGDWAAAMGIEAVYIDKDAEYGCGLGLAYKQRRAGLALAVEKALALDGISAELKTALQGWLDNKEDADGSRKYGEDILAQLDEVHAHDCALAHELGEMADLFTKKSVWVFGGDGWAYDIGYGGLDHVLASGDDINVLVLDTEVYSNTGGQASKATPLGAIAQFAAAGKRIGKKDLGRMAMSYGYVYVASISMGADKQQVLKAFREAEAYKGPSLIIAYAPCINQGIRKGMGKSMEEGKLAVETGYWPLYRFNPDLALEGKNPFQLDSKEPKDGIQEFMAGETRFAALDKKAPEVSKQLKEELAKSYSERYKLYKQLADLPHPGSN